MAHAEWHIEDPKPHTVSVEHGFWSGRVSIQVDEQEIFRRSSKIWDTGVEHRFEIDGTPCIVRIILRVFSYSYELWVDGKLK